MGGAGSSLVFWNTDQDTAFFRANLPNIVHEMDMHPNGLRLATAHANAHLRISRMGAKEA